jgi:hypothetical protein
VKQVILYGWWFLYLLFLLWSSVPVVCLENAIEMQTVNADAFAANGPAWPRGKMFRVVSIHPGRGQGDRSPTNFFAGFVSCF